MARAGEFTAADLGDSAGAQRVGRRRSGAGRRGTPGIVEEAFPTACLKSGEAL